MHPVFHIGFPKAGSTYLQRQVFPHLPDYAYMGVHAFVDEPDFYDLLNRFHIQLFKTDGLNFDVQACAADKSKIERRADGKSPLFSYEYAVGVLFGYPDAVMKAQRLREIFGANLKIIMIVREQTAILKSQYRDHPFEPHDIHRGKPVSFAEWYKQTNALRYFRFTDLVEYDRLVRVYDDLFGADNVLVLPMELMKADPDLYAAKMAEFLEVDQATLRTNLDKPPVNTGHSAGQNRLRRLRRAIPIPVQFSKILPRALYTALTGLIKKGGKEEIIVPQDLQQDINARYALSNKALESRIGVALAPLGYAVDRE